MSERPNPDPFVATQGRVLIVDDNRDAAELLRELLQMDGYDVRVALDPIEALAVFAEFRPRVALLDIGLPGMDGHELARRLREAHGPDACALVALTGYGQPGDLERGARSGFAAYLVKPVELDGLVALLEKLMSQRPRA